MKIQKIITQAVKTAIEEMAVDIASSLKDDESRDNIERCIQTFRHTVNNGVRVTVPYDELGDKYSTKLIRNLLGSKNCIAIFKASRNFPVKDTGTLEMFKRNCCECIVYFDNNQNDYMVIDIIEIEAGYKSEIYDTDYTFNCLLK